jgi:hypothetical protein
MGTNKGVCVCVAGNVLFEAPRMYCAESRVVADVFILVVHQARRVQQPAIVIMVLEVKPTLCWNCSARPESGFAQQGVTPQPTALQAVCQQARSVT